MKINAIKDKSGRVVATSPNDAGNGAQVKPILAAGQKLEQVEVPENYHANPDKIYK
jgi:hypothetical protein